jgi:ribosomal-protein-alanine N-acetyltransferase
MNESLEARMTLDAPPLPVGKRMRLVPVTREILTVWKQWFLADDPHRLTCRPVKIPDISLTLKAWMEREANGTGASFGVVSLDASTLLGRVSYFDHNFRNGAVEIGFVTAPEVRHQGVAREYLELFLEYLFEGLGVRKVMAQTGAFNGGSQALLQAAGFREDGRLREHHLLDGVFHDDVLFSLLASEHEHGVGCPGERSIF